MVGKYAQTKQRRLKGKVVKSSHGRPYKRTLAVPCKEDQKTEVLGSKRKNKRKRKERRKDKRANRKQRERV